MSRRGLLPLQRFNVRQPVELSDRRVSLILNHEVLVTDGANRSSWFRHPVKSHEFPPRTSAR